MTATGSGFTFEKYIDDRETVRIKVICSQCKAEFVGDVYPVKSWQAEHLCCEAQAKTALTQSLCRTGRTSLE